MATNLNVRIVNKNDTYDALQSSNFIPLKGEIVLAEVLTTNTDVHGNRYEVPTYLMKVGDNEHKFSELKWLHAPASDVYAWAKASGLVVEVTGQGNAITSAQWSADKLILTKGETFATKAQLDAAINALSADGGAIHEIDERVTALEASVGTGNAKEAIDAAQADATKALSDAATAQAAANKAQGEVDALETTVSTLSATVEANKTTAATAVNDEKTARETADTQIRTDFAAADTTTLNSAKSYADGKATEVIGTDSDAATADTVKGAKKYADGKASDAETNAKAYADSLAGNYDAKGSASTAEANAKAYAKEYADGLADNYDAAGSAAQALADAKTDATEKADAAKSAAVASAKSYTDEREAAINSVINPIANRVTTAEGKITTLEGQVSALSSATHFLGVKTELPAEAAKGDIVIVGNKEYVYDPDATVTVEGTKWVELGDTTAEQGRLTTLEGAVEDLEGEIADIDTAYKAADSAIDAKVEVIKGDYLKASDKTELTGAIATAKQEAISAAASDATSKAGTAETNAKDYADGLVEDEVAAREAADKAITDSIGNVETGKTVVQMINEAKTAATYDDTALKARVKANEDAIAVVNGEATQAGSIAKALADAKSYADGIIATEKAAREAEDTAIDDRLDTLEAIDHSKYALGTDLNGVTTRVGNIETSLATGGATANAIAAAKKAGDDAQKDVDDLSATVTTNMSKTVTFEDGFLKAGADTIIFNCGSATLLID